MLRSRKLDILAKIGREVRAQRAAACGQDPRTPQKGPRSSLSTMKLQEGFEMEGNLSVFKVFDSSIRYSISDIILIIIGYCVVVCVFSVSSLFFCFFFPLFSVSFLFKRYWVWFSLTRSVLGGFELDIDPTQEKPEIMVNCILHSVSGWVWPF